MFVELKAPCSLPLGLAPSAADPAAPLAWVSLTLKFPLVELRAQFNPDGLSVVGPRAHIAYRYADRLAASRPSARQTDVEIEWAIPSHMGLGADPALGMAVARAQAWVLGEAEPDLARLAHEAGLAAEPAAWGVAQGGLLLVGAEAVWRRAVVAHASEDEDWVVVFVLPRAPEGTPGDYEASRAAALRTAAAHLDAAAAYAAQTRLFAAVEANDLPAFATAWAALDQTNRNALALAEALPPETAEAQAVLAVMRDHAALVSGQSLTGLALFGLVQGASASQRLRKSLRACIGHEGGTVSAAIMSPAGAELAPKDGPLRPPFQQIRMVPQDQ